MIKIRFWNLSKFAFYILHICTIMSDKKFFIGIRYEDKSIWERRVALVPQHVKEVMEEHPDVQFIVEPSSIRVFTDRE